MSTSHARRFVQSAWTLLSFQLIASVGAVAVTGIAAFHVQRLAVELESARGPQTADGADTAIATEVGEETVIHEGPRGDAADSTATEAPADPAVQQTSESATDAGQVQEAAAADTPRPGDAVVRCQRQDSVIRVQASNLWCDTGIEVRRGQTVIIVTRGQWSHGGRPGMDAAGGERRAEGALSSEAPLGALVGRIGEYVFPIGAGGTMTMRTSGTLHLSINDVPGEIGDNQGFVDVFLQSPAAQ